MFIFFYSLTVLLWDLLWFVTRAYFSIVLGLWHFICPPIQKSLIDRVIVIAGAGRGIGRELALQMADLGAKVVSWDIDRDATLELAAKGLQLKGKIFPYIVDITDRDQVMNAAEKVRREMGPINMIINTCNMPSRRWLIAPPRDAQSIFDLCVLSHFWMAQAILPQMLQQREGHIVVFSSVAGLTGIKEHAPLTVSQFAVQGYAEALRQELHTKHKNTKIKITVVHVYPFLVSPEFETDIRTRIPSYLGTCEPEDVARRVIVGVRRGLSEMSVPGYLIYLGNFFRLMPRRMTILVRDFLDTGVDFG